MQQFAIALLQSACPIRVWNGTFARQTAAFRPAQKWAQAYEWERLAITELEAHFILRYVLNFTSTFEYLGG